MTAKIDRFLSNAVALGKSLFFSGEEYSFLISLNLLQ